AEPLPDDRAVIEASRTAITTAIRSGGLQDAPATKWPIRYSARRIAWHVLDQAWEIEDRSLGQEDGRS
ncbi:MAG: hypothetical protein O2822_03935, partial [Chloroflexi bacterium]|nr:hypothetical protein [Chloroflexota bacterium]